MTILALTGGIASGKSTIASQLRDYGATHIDADQLAREAVAKGSPGLEQLVQRFGSEILDASGVLDRAKLASVVFGDVNAREEVNAIVHPEVRRLAHERIQEAREKNSEAVVVYDIPLLVETGTMGDWDVIVVAEAPELARIERMMTLRGMSEEEAKQRIAAQASDQARREIADVIIDTSGSIEHTTAQVKQLWTQISHKEFAT